MRTLSGPRLKHGVPLHTPSHELATLRHGLFDDVHQFLTSGRQAIAVGDQAEPPERVEWPPPPYEGVGGGVGRDAHAGHGRHVVERSTGAAKSKSNRATAAPSRNTTFSRHTSLWHTTLPSAGSASSRFQVVPSGASKPLVASWKRANRPATDASAWSVCDQTGTAARPRHRG